MPPSQPAKATKAYQNAIKLNALNISALTSLGMLAQEAGEITLAIDRYHQALAIHSNDPIATFLLEKALKEQVDLGACRFDGLPGSLMDPELDPFGFTDERIGLVGVMGQNRLLQLPPFPDYGALEAEREKRESKGGDELEEQEGEEESLVTVDETGIASLDGEVDLDADVEEEGDGVSEDDEEEGGEGGDEEGENTAMSVSMSMSMERDESGSEGGVGDEDEDERMSITMDLE
jgi:hypothetical protein